VRQCHQEFVAKLDECALNPEALANRNRDWILLRTMDNPACQARSGSGRVTHGVDPTSEAEHSPIGLG